MGKFCYSREIETIEGKETFAMIETASFDEAKKEVDKGIRDRRLELADKHFDVHIPTESTPSKVESGDAATPAGDPTIGVSDSADQRPAGTGQEGQA